jgi:aminoglycoside/choline kinase family phosphotransferase
MHSLEDTIRAWLREEGRAPIELRALPGDASVRRFFRVRDARGPSIAMYSPGEDLAPFLLVEEKLRSSGLNVPRIVAANRAKRLLLMTDLGETHYLDLLSPDRADELYENAIGALLRMQCATDAADLPPYDESLLRRELDLFPEWFLGRHLRLPVEPSTQRRLEALYSVLCRSADEQPRVFVHRDYHSRNLIHSPPNDPGILDFQDAVHGPISYDLVSLLRDVYVAWPADRVDRWIARYYRGAREHGLLDGVDAARFRRWLDLMGVQRHLKIAGIFARLHHRDGKAGYLKNIAAALDHVVEVARAYPELEAIGRMLDDARVRDSLAEQNRRALAAVR